MLACMAVDKPCVDQPGRTVGKDELCLVLTGGGRGLLLTHPCVTPPPGILAALGVQGAGPMASVSCVAMVIFLD